MLEGAGARRPTFPFPQLRRTDRQISRYAGDAPTREESARTDSLSSALSRVRLLPSYAGSESHSKETRGTLAHATYLFSTVRCRLHIGSHMGVLDLRWYSTLRIGEEPSPLGRAEPYLMAACPWPRTAHSRQMRRRGAPGQAVCRAWVSGNTDASTHIQVGADDTTDFRPSRFLS